MNKELDVLFLNGTIITMANEDRYALKGCVCVADGKIAYVGEEMPRVSAKRVIDCKSAIIMPGLINTHSHTSMTVMRGYADDYALDEWLYQKVFPAEARLDARAVLAGFRLGAAEMIRNGVTSFSDMYCYEPDIARAAIEIGIRASLSNGVIAIGDGFDFENDRSIRETRILMNEFNHAHNDLIRADASIHGEYTSLPVQWRFMRDIALENNAVLHIHLSETKKEHEDCKKRRSMTPAEALYKEGVFEAKTLAAHCVWAEESDMEIMRENGVSVAHCPVSNLKLASGIANIKKLMESGVNVALGTDGCCSNNTLDLFEEIKLAALLAKGVANDSTAVPAYDALKMATVNGAIAQDRANIGQIKEGFDADLILIDANALNMNPLYDVMGAIVYGARGSDVKLTMVQGKILFENGEFTTIDTEKALYEVNTYGKKKVLGL